MSHQGSLDGDGHVGFDDDWGSLVLLSGTRSIGFDDALLHLVSAPGLGILVVQIDDGDHLGLAAQHIKVLREPDHILLAQVESGPHRKIIVGAKCSNCLVEILIVTMLSDDYFWRKFDRV